MPENEPWEDIHTSRVDRGVRVFAAADSCVYTLDTAVGHEKVGPAGLTVTTHRKQCSVLDQQLIHNGCAAHCTERERFVKTRGSPENRVYYQCQEAQ